MKGVSESKEPNVSHQSSWVSLGKKRGHSVFEEDSFPVWAVIGFVKGRDRALTMKNRCFGRKAALNLDHITLVWWKGGSSLLDLAERPSSSVRG